MMGGKICGEQVAVGNLSRMRLDNDVDRLINQPYGPLLAALSRLQDNIVNIKWPQPGRINKKPGVSALLSALPPYYEHFVIGHESVVSPKERDQKHNSI